MKVLRDLSDARRDKKPFLPTSDLDVSEGRVYLTPTSFNTEHPTCFLHGHMARVSPDNNYYRCMEMFCGLGGTYE